MPAKVGVVSSDDPLCEIEVDDESYDIPNGDEERGGNFDGYVCEFSCPHYPQTTSYDPGHAEPKHGTRHDELVTAFSIDLEDGHVTNSAEGEEGEEDRSNGYIE